MTLSVPAVVMGLYCQMASAFTVLNRMAPNCAVLVPASRS